ncbi:MAG: MarR family transcriptional regulator [Ignavibacteriaceae bacterium]
MGSNYKGTIEEVRVLNTYIKLQRATDSVNARINSFLSKSGLTESQFFMLDALFHLGPLSQKELGNKLLKSGGNITMVVDNLEERKLVKRKRSKKDRRLIYVHLTEKGEKKIKEYLPGVVDTLMKEMKIISTEDQETLQRLCKKIGFS